MNSHKHAELMAAYAADAQTTNKPWELWQYQNPGFTGWANCYTNPEWASYVNYRRKPKTYTITLTEEQLKEILMACDFPNWENEDFKSAVQTLEAALGVQPKTNAQIACDMLGQAHDALEAHSAEIVEPNVDHIQKLVWDAKNLLEV